MPIQTIKTNEIFCDEPNQLNNEEEEIYEIKYNEYDYFVETILNLPFRCMNDFEFNYYKKFFIRYVGKNSDFIKSERVKNRYIKDLAKFLYNFREFNSFNEIYEGMEDYFAEFYSRRH